MQKIALYELAGVGKEYDGPSEKLVILRALDLKIYTGESLAIVGTSGSGKSTLLHLLGTLDTPTWGEICFDGQGLGRLNAAEKARLRNRDIGYVFQFHHLLPEFSAEENVAMPALLGGMARRKALGLAREALDLVGLASRNRQRVTTLSGGERQRAAIARAILMRPKVLLADEPTGNLDEHTGTLMGDMLAELNKELGMTLVVVTHNRELAHRMGRCLELRSGELYEECPA